MQAFIDANRRARWVCVCRLCIAMLAGVALFSESSIAAPANQASHLEQHRQQMAEFLKLREADPKRALAFAQSALERTRSVSSSDPRRGDALELLALAYAGLDQFDKALLPVTELVRLRRAARPIDNELLALALGEQALILFGVDRAAEADAALREQLRVYRAAFGANDLRLAQKLELQAEYAQKGFGRTQWVIELLKEAVKIRTANKGSSPGKLAETLQELAIHQMTVSQIVEADANLERAVALIEGDMSANPEREESKAGLAQMLVMRAGIAASLGRKDDAYAFARRARAIRFRDAVLQAENDILVAAVFSTILENQDNIAGAIDEQKKILDVYRRNQELVSSGALDAGGIGDTFLRLATLYRKQDDLSEARQAIRRAREVLGDTSDVLIQLSEIERRSGAQDRALDLYQRALNARKTKASEVTVMFGTNRAPIRGKEEGAFAGDTDADISLGRAVVLVPGGEFSDDAWVEAKRKPPIPVGRATNPDPLIIRSKKVVQPAEFDADVKKIVAAERLYPNSALVFVHGFNVSFDEALHRGAQLARDLNYDGPMFVYSWPSKGSKFAYGTDRVTAASSVDGLVRFLHTVAQTTEAQKIHIVAHSMGNRVMLPALVRITSEKGGTIGSKLGEVVLAAPAVPQQEFGDWIDDLRAHGFDRLTLYASAIDVALMVGYVREGATTLAGYVANGEPLLHPPVQSIDVSEAGGETLFNMNHDVFASNPVVTEDIRQLLQNGLRPPEQRIKNLESRKSKSQNLSYWYYRLFPKH